MTNPKPKALNPKQKLSLKSLIFKTLSLLRVLSLVFRVSPKVGFTLLEVIIFTTIFSMFMVQAAGIVSVSLQNIKSNENKIVATHLAQEATEWVKGEKEEGWSDFVATRAAADPGLTWCFNTTPLSDWPSSGACDSDDFSLKNFYKREVKITSSSDGNQATVETTISWRDKGEIQNTLLATILTPFEGGSGFAFAPHTPTPTPTLTPTPTPTLTPTPTPTPASYNFSYTETDGDDISSTSFADFLNTFTPSTSWYASFEVKSNTDETYGQWCAERADWYRVNYLTYYTGSEVLTSGTWNKWYKTTETDSWTNTTQGFTNYFGTSCSGTPNAWCSEWCMGSRCLGIFPAHVNHSESYQPDGGGYSQDGFVNIKFAPNRLGACGF